MFATQENFKFTFPASPTYNIGYARTVLCVPLHTACATISAIGIANVMTNGRNRMWCIAYTLPPALIHGLFNYSEINLLFTSDCIAIVCAMFILWVLFKMPSHNIVIRTRPQPYQSNQQRCIV